MRDQSCVAKGGGDAAPCRCPGIAERQMNYDSTDGSFDPGAELEESFAQGGYLGSVKLGAGGSPSDLLHQDVSRGRQQNAELAGLEIGATGQVDLKPVAVRVLSSVSGKTETLYADLRYQTSLGG